MKKPIYPKRLSLSVICICLFYLVSLLLQLSIGGGVSGMTSAEITGLVPLFVFAFGLATSLGILREKEALYSMVLASFIYLFFYEIISLTYVVMSSFDWLIIVILALHLIVLRSLSYRCFDAVVGGGNYTQEKEIHTNKKEPRTKKKKN